MTTKTKESIWTTWEGFVYLWTKEYQQSSGTQKQLSEWIVTKIKNSLEGLSVNGMYQIASGHFGWGVGEMQRMLNEAGFKNIKGEDIVYSSI